MRDAVVRIARIRIENLKNVEYGELSFVNNRRPKGASVLGLYGQNGSGKSALVDALEMVQQCISGRRTSARFTSFVNVGADHAAIECEFSVVFADEGEKYTVVYAFKAKSEVDEPLEIELDERELLDTGDDDNDFEPKRRSMRIYDEVLKVRAEGPEKRMRLTTLFDTSIDDPFGNASKRMALVGNDAASLIELVVEKKLAYRDSRSFVFSTALRQAVLSKKKGDDGEVDTIAEVARKALSSLASYGRMAFFVLNTRDSGMPALGALPFPFRYENEKGLSIVSGLRLPIEEIAVVSEKTYELLAPAIRTANIVLQQLVPGLTIEVCVLGDKIMSNGKKGKIVQVVSRRDGRTIPLSCESEGIKRIISFLNLLILMYNDPSVTVVIDEIDAGVFEYLLGELLSIVSEHGKGQLIFTSHNLRPLETIDRGFIAFTTTNPKKRYWRMTNVKTSNNLRDFYYRDIMLGGQEEPLYDSTSNGDIEFALMEAGIADEA